MAVNNSKTCLIFLVHIEQLRQFELESDDERFGVVEDGTNKLVVVGEEGLVESRAVAATLRGDSGDGGGAERREQRADQQTQRPLVRPSASSATPLLRRHRARASAAPAAGGGDSTAARGGRLQASSRRDHDVESRC